MGVLYKRVDGEREKFVILPNEERAKALGSADGVKLTKVSDKKILAKFGFAAPEKK